MLVDWWNAIPPSICPFQWSNIFDLDYSDVEMEHDNDNGVRTITERWRFDVDDVLVFGPESLEKQNRTLVDNYAEKYCILFLQMQGNWLIFQVPTLHDGATAWCRSAELNHQPQHPHGSWQRMPAKHDSIPVGNAATAATSSYTPSTSFTNPHSTFTPDEIHPAWTAPMGTACWSPQTPPSPPSTNSNPKGNIPLPSFCSLTSRH